MTRLLTTAEVADRLAVSEDWVRAHAADLGAIKLGAHRGAPLRFERGRIQDVLEAHRLRPHNHTGHPRRRRSRAAQEGTFESVELVPVREGLL